LGDNRISTKQTTAQSLSLALVTPSSVIALIAYGSAKRVDWSMGNSTTQVNLFPAIFGIPTPSQSHLHPRIPEKTFASSFTHPQ
jgi:hypothetical protein